MEAATTHTARKAAPEKTYNTITKGIQRRCPNKKLSCIWRRPDDDGIKVAAEAAPLPIHKQRDNQHRMRSAKEGNGKGGHNAMQKEMKQHKRATEPSSQSESEQRMVEQPEEQPKTAGTPEVAYSRNLD